MLTSDLPIRTLATEQIAPDTHVIRHLIGEGVGPFAVHLNSMVITGAEPVVVDTGSHLYRDAWFDQVQAVVEPEDVRWIYLSHDDHDHTGNLVEALERFPNATVVMTHFMVERLAADLVLPYGRMRWVNDGETFSAGDRELVAVRPPIFDSPVTRGLFDPTTGVYWASDAFAAPVSHEVTDISELDPGFWREGFSMFQRMISPWHEYLDPARYATLVERTRVLGATVVASAHSPTLRGAQIESALTLMGELPHLPAPELPGQADLDELLAAVTAGPGAVVEAAA